MLEQIPHVGRIRCPKELNLYDSKCKIFCFGALFFSREQAIQMGNDAIGLSDKEATPNFG